MVLGEREDGIQRGSHPLPRWTLGPDPGLEVPEEERALLAEDGDVEILLFAH